MQFRIDTSAAQRFAKTLQEMGKSAFPIAIRQTLNNAAFDVKQNTMPKRAEKTFEKRQPNFFKANSKVEMAKGFDIKSMKATVGFTPKKGFNKAVQELDQQEHGGSIGGRSFITTSKARVSNSWKKKVRADLRFENISRMQIINAQKVRITGQKANAKQRFVRAAIMAKKLHDDNAFVLGNKWGDGMQTLSKIDSISFDKKARTIKINRTPVYTYRPKRKITVASTNFMKRASMETGLSLGKWFQINAIKQLKKLQTKN